MAVGFSALSELLRI